MKKNKYFQVKLLLISFLSIIIPFQSCDEDKFLEEIPKDFYSPENSFVTYEDFNAAVLNIHYKLRAGLYSDKKYSLYWALGPGLTDLSYPPHKYGPEYDVRGNMLTPTSSVPTKWWFPLYQIIYDANAIMERVDSKTSELTEDQKNKIRAEGAFFRAYAHKILANIWGDVPLVLEETKGPKRDYVRTPRKQVYEQCAADLEFAVANLPDINDVDLTRVSNVAASHLLSELYITLEKWDDAIDAASFVINHTSTALMTERFGNKIENPNFLGFNDDPDFDGDLYWDLFFKGNQDRSAGNTEAIWLMPYAYNVPGGGAGGPGVRAKVSRLWKVKIKNNDGSKVIMIPHPNENYGGRGAGMSRPSPYFEGKLWEKSGEGDIRNAPHNIIFDWKVNNPSSDHNGKWLVKDNLVPKKSFADTMRNFFPMVAKATTFQSFPEEVIIDDQTVPGSIAHETPSKRCWKHHYLFRLAETYLYRAEAYLGKGDKAKAASDINVIRRRAKATEITASDVDIDYILDERMRELHFETPYLCTLARLGKTAERVRKNFPKLGRTYEDYHNLWPIPYGEIEKNIEAELEQNPGYGY